MIISNSHKFIFIHIHKCGGTSIAHALDPILQWNDIQCGGTDLGEQFQPIYQKRFGLKKHSTAMEVLEVVGKELWEDYFTFSLVRNPFSRAVSLYTFAQKMVKNRGKKKFIRFLGNERKQPVWSWPIVQAYLDSSSFSEFIRHKGFESDSGAQPLVSFLHDAKGKQLVDRTYKLENLTEDFPKICSRISVNDLTLLHANASREANSCRGFYKDNNDYSLIYELYKHDFLHFNYSMSDPI